MIPVKAMEREYGDYYLSNTDYAQICATSSRR